MNRLGWVWFDPAEAVMDGAVDERFQAG